MDNVEVRPRILLVDDNSGVLATLRQVLEISDFHVTTASNAPEALQLIASEPFDVLLSDLHMPGAGDGFTVISAMRHTNPQAVTLLLSGYPALPEAMNAILLQADQVMLKPMHPRELIATIHENLEKAGRRAPVNVERVATILERESPTTIDDWFARVELESELSALPLTKEQRTFYLFQLLEELIHRLRVPRALGTKQVSEAAVQHGKIRHSQGYSLSMIIEESRILQVSIFDTLNKNLATVDFSLLLSDVMTIADECDSQLKQAIVSFAAEPSPAAASSH
jgi:DNA-binding response OmpR family regulator